VKVLPAFVWPPQSWVDIAHQERRFGVGYPARLPKGGYYTRYWLPEGRWLSIPVRHAQKDTPFLASWPPESRWRTYHWRTLLTLYGKTPFFYEWKPFLEYLYLEARLPTLQAFCDTILTELARLYGWTFYWSEDPPLTLSGPAREPTILAHLLRVGI